jgi:hypothetical protein
MKFNHLISRMIQNTKISEMSMKHYCGIVSNGKLICSFSNTYGQHAEFRALKYLYKLCPSREGKGTYSYSCKN